MSKSYVSLEQRICPVCRKPHDTGAILMDKRLEESMDMTTITGWGLCSEHQKMHEDGFIALVETKNPEPSNGRLSSNDARPTGTIVHIKRDFFDSISNGTVDSSLPVIYCNSDSIKKVTDIYNKLVAEQEATG